MSAFTMVPVSELIQVMRALDGDRQSRVRRTLEQEDLLILDDLGMERDTKFGLETVYDVIDGRYLSGKPLIVTTNLTLREMQKETDLDKRRIYDRVLTMTTPLFFGRENLRNAGKNQKMALMKKLIAEPERRDYENGHHLV